MDTEQVVNFRIPASIVLMDTQIKLTTANGQEHMLAVGQSVEGWVLRWLGGRETTPRAILESTTAAGGAFLFWSDADGMRTVIKPRPAAYENPAGSVLYGGHTMVEVLASQRDILGEEVLAQGEPTYAAVAGLLPPIRSGRYQILGSPTSRGKLLIWPNGSVTTQARQRPNVLYDPAVVDGRTTGCKVYDGLLDDWMPIACYRYEAEDIAFDLLAFILPDDYAILPEPIFCLRRYDKPDYESGEARYRQVHREADEDLQAEVFYQALDATVRYWWNFEESLTQVHLPDEQAWRWTKGCLAVAATTFAGDHPKYGAAKYAGEHCDTFPPAMLTMAETHLAWGATEQAFDYMRYYLKRVVRIDGSFNFRGPSGTEYGQWLWLLNEVEKGHGPQPWITLDLDKVVATGHLLESLRHPVGEPPLRLVKIGAEDDNRHEDYIFFSNNLWVIRGLRSLADLLERRDHPGKARQVRDWVCSLAQDVQQAIQTYAESTDLGPVLPSYIGYPADLWTTSIGPDLPADVPAWEKQAFLSAQSHVPKGFGQSEGAPRQWIRENTYANYRYHLEALSAMELDREHAETLVRVRQERGGQILGTTRFMGWMDDWPVAAYARYLLSNDRINDYLLLYYGHMAHHGNRETLTYYEQITIDGEVKANDCAPTLLITPMMTRWMLCFEPIDEDAIYLLRATPRAWLSKGEKISAQGLVSSAGCLDVCVAVEQGYVVVDVTIPNSAEPRQIYLDIRLPEGQTVQRIRAGIEWIAQIQDGYRLLLQPHATGTLHAELAI